MTHYDIKFVWRTYTLLNARAFYARKLAAQIMIDVHRRVMVDIGLLHFAFLFIVFRFFLRSTQLKKNYSIN